MSGKQLDLIEDADDSEGIFDGTPRKRRRALKVDVIKPGERINRSNPGMYPQRAPVSIQMFRDWRDVNGPDAKGSYFMVGLWDHIPEDIVGALIDEGHGPGSYLLCDAAGNKSRWAVTAHHLRERTGRAPVEPGESEEAAFDRWFERMQRMKTELAEEPRQENPTPAPGVDWSKALMMLIPAVQPLIKALTDKLLGTVNVQASAPVAPASQPAASAPPSGDPAWADLQSLCERMGIKASDLRQSIEQYAGQVNA